jgi:hypothetical protein
MGEHIAKTNSAVKKHAGLVMSSRVDRKVIRELAGGSFIERAHNVVLLGPPGVEKTHLAVALGVKAVEAGYSALFLTLESLIGPLIRAHENRLERTLQQLTYVHIDPFPEREPEEARRRDADNRHQGVDMLLSDLEHGNVRLADGDKHSSWNVEHGGPFEPQDAATRASYLESRRRCRTCVDALKRLGLRRMGSAISASSWS